MYHVMATAENTQYERNGHQIRRRWSTFPAKIGHTPFERDAALVAASVTWRTEEIDGTGLIIIVNFTVGHI